MNNKYQYVRPEGTKHKISMREWNKAFGYRGRWPFLVCEVYVTDERAVVHHVISVWGQILLVTFLPLFYLVGILQEGFSKTHGSIKSALFDKPLGSFSSDVVYAGRNPQWAKLNKLIRG